MQASFGNLLNVKPILTIKDGKLDLLERMRTRKKAWAHVIDLAAEAAGQYSVERLAIIHINALEEAGQFLEQLGKSVKLPQDIFFAELTPGLSIYGGTGLVGVCFVKGKSAFFTIRPIMNDLLRIYPAVTCARTVMQTRSQNRT